MNKICLCFILIGLKINIINILTENSLDNINSQAFFLSLTHTHKQTRFTLSAFPQKNYRS